jgi:hypothetical protein
VAVSAFGQDPQPPVDLAAEPQLTEGALPNPPKPGTAETQVQQARLYPEPLTPPDWVAPAPVQRYRLVLEGAVQVLYDDNVNTQRINKQEDIVISLAPRASFELGDFREKKDSFLFLSYAPTAHFFLEGHADNSLDHDAYLDAQIAMPRLLLHSKLEFQSLTDAEIDVGTRTTRQIYTAALGARYELLPKTAVTLDFNFYDYEYQTRIDSREGNVKLGLEYAFSEKLTLGLVGGFGLLKPEDTDLQTYELGALRVDWRPTEKFSVRGEFGADFRQTAQADKAEPVGLLAAYWEPRDSTHFSLEFSREVRASAALAGKNYVATMIRARVQQRLFQKFFLNLRGGYTHSDYYATHFVVSSDRTDDYYFVRPSVEFIADRGWRVEVFYLYRTLDSNNLTYSFDNNQVGMEISIAF